MIIHQADVGQRYLACVSYRKSIGDRGVSPKTHLSYGWPLRNCYGTSQCSHRGRGGSGHGDRPTTRSAGGDGGVGSGVAHGDVLRACCAPPWNEWTPVAHEGVTSWHTVVVVQVTRCGEEVPVVVDRIGIRYR